MSTNAKISDSVHLVADLIDQLQAHHSCPVCSKVYRWKRNLRRHLVQECGKTPRYMCPYCSYVSKHKSDLRRHCKRRHPTARLNEHHLLSDPLELHGLHDPLGGEADQADHSSLSTPAAPVKAPQAVARPVAQWVPGRPAAGAVAEAFAGAPSVSLPLITTVALTPSGRQLFVSTRAPNDSSSLKDL